MEGKVPGGGELWHNAETNQWFLAYQVPHTGKWMLWGIEDHAQLTFILTDSVTANLHPGTADRTFNNAQSRMWGLTQGGFSRELNNKSPHPFTELVANWDKLLRSRPYYADPEVLAMHVDALLEGRPVTIDDWASTNWWRTRNEKERAWIITQAQDPSTALKRMEDARLITRNALMEAGVRDPNERLVELMGLNLTSGKWTEEYYKQQIKYLADPFSRPGGAGLDWEIERILRETGTTVDTTQREVDKVTEAVQRYLGPAFAGGWKDANIQYWAGQIRNDPDAAQQLKTTLQQQFQSLFPAYKDNPNADYETVAAPWRSYVNQLWGQDPDETDPLFLRVVAMNDAQAAAEVLRKEGLNRGVGKVVSDATEALGGQFGFGVIPTGR